MFLVYHRLKVWAGLIRCFGAYFFGAVSLPGAVDACSPRSGGRMIVSVVMCGEYHPPIPTTRRYHKVRKRATTGGAGFCANVAENRPHEQGNPCTKPHTKLTQPPAFDNHPTACYYLSQVNTVHHLNAQGTTQTHTLSGLGRAINERYSEYDTWQHPSHHQPL